MLRSTLRMSFPGVATAVPVKSVALMIVSPRLADVARSRGTYRWIPIRIMVGGQVQARQ